MAKGAIAKKEIFDTLLKTFDGSFMFNNGKELRINWMEEDTPVQIKVALTCAKEAVSPEGEVLKAIEKKEEKQSSTPIDTSPVSNLTEPTEEEKKTVEDLLKSLGLD